MADSLSELRVAVVDDDPLMRQLLSGALRQLGVELAGSAQDGAEALALLEAGPVDVLVCDLNMPGMDGIELLRHLAERPNAPALAMVSGDAHILRIAADLGRAHRLRVLGTIPKPMSPDALRAVLERLWSGAGETRTGEGIHGLPLDEDEILAMVPDALELHYQPQVHLATGRTVSVEALARLRHASGLLGPRLFVPLCEQRGVSLRLFQAVVRGALEQVAKWRSAGMDLRIAVNASADDLRDVTMVERVVTASERAGVPLDAFTLELTETRILPDATGPIEVLSRLRMKGARLSIDDYGTGWSSLQQLRRVAFHELKIDQSFVSNSTTDDRAGKLVASTVQLARELSLTTVAEGVETAEQLALVTRLGCDLGQGYHLARPMPVAEATRWLEAHC